MSITIILIKDKFFGPALDTIETSSFLQAKIVKGGGLIWVFQILKLMKF